MIQLNKIALDGMVQTNTFSADLPKCEALSAADGSLVVFVEKSTSKNIDLESYEDSGWINVENAELLYEAAASVTGVYSLEIEGRTHSVRFRHEDAPALVLNPVSRGVDNYFFGKIKLKTV